MKEDRDLQFLASCKSEDLKTLVDMMTYDKDGGIRLSEQLTDTDAYLRYYPDRLPCMWQEIANELQRFGGNTLVNICRRGGSALSGNFTGCVPEDGSLVLRLRRDRGDRETFAGKGLHGNGEPYAGERIAGNGRPVRCRREASAEIYGGVCPSDGDTERRRVVYPDCTLCSADGIEDVIRQGRVDVGRKSVE